MLDIQKDQLILFDVRASLWRVLLLLAAIAATIFVVFVARWYLGNTMAEFAPHADQGGLESAQSAVNFAPRDPLAQMVLGKMEKDTLDIERAGEAVKHFEEAVKLSPNDYRYWLELGRAREQSSDIAGGEKAFRRAVALAPSYSYPRWYLGNLLFRANRRDEAFVELRKAGESNSSFLPQVCVLAWYTFDNNVAEMEKVLGDKPQTRAALSIFLASKGKAEDALRLWKGLSKENKERLQTNTDKNLFKTLFQAENYRAALQIAKEIKGETAGEVGKIANAGFENSVSGNDPISFGWRVSSTPQADIKIEDGIKQDGNRSVRIIFNSYSANTFANVWQIIAVEPDTRYRLTFWVRTKDLKTGGPPKIEVVTPVESRLLVESKPVPLDTNDWQEMTIEFNSPTKPDGVIVRTNRIPCEPACNIFGTVWYDNFNLQRIGAATETKRDDAGNRSNSEETKQTPAR